MLKTSCNKRLINTRSKNLIKRITISAIFIFSINIAFCAVEEEPFFKIPNYDSLNVNIHSKSSPNYYPTIFERYMQGDTTLTLDNYHHLYYGYTFNVNYNPLIVNPLEDSLMMVMARNRDSKYISPEIFKDMERVALKSLYYNPFDINVLNILTFINQMSGNEQEAIKYGDKVRKIKEVILSSGNGTSKNSPFHVISRREEESMLGSLGVESVKRSYVTIDIEYFLLKNRFNGSKGLFFNIGRMWIKAPQDRKKPEKKFEFNPTFNPKSKRYIKPPTF